METEAYPERCRWLFVSFQMNVVSFSCVLDEFKLLLEQIQAELVLVRLKRSGVDYHARTCTEVDRPSIFKARSEKSALNVNYRPHPSQGEYQKKKIISKKGFERVKNLLSSN